ncbi:myrosinase 1-like [Schistocerca americana]|uniref:myrosinase 1-like n=1 Tax=Schistocerca americana TaxID=7009 RepID=UPI001F500E20|nr:myrosinase 1-like [Schistocerca americana]
MLAAIFFAALVAVGSTQSTDNKFPDGFFMGCATASYQIEGAWNEDGKGENIWDHMFHEHPEYGTNGDNGDVACDSYHKYKEDVQMLKALNVDVYRFSISWPRILPTGDVDIINQPGIDYYNNLINELLDNGIEPMVTMYHWDLPQALQYIGGWTNGLMADYFVEYARVLFDNFGDRVKWWITFNEPEAFVRGYANEGWAPSQPAPGIGDYLAAHTLLKAHGRVYRLYDQQYRAAQNGSVGITLNIQGSEPLTNSTEDIEAAERYQQFEAGLYAHPIFSQEGDYPAVMRERVDANSEEEGRPRSRLPSFTQEEVEYIRGSADFFGLNHYRTYYVVNGANATSPSRAHDSGTTAVSSGFYSWGFRNLLNWIVNEYPGYRIIVTENGIGNTGGLNDTDRIQYYTDYLTALLQAVNIDGVPVIGYTAWSLMDNLEWTSGFTKKFGLYEVDFNSPNRTRTPKDSATFMADIFLSKQVPELS